MRPLFKCSFPFSSVLVYFNMFIMSSLREIKANKESVFITGCDSGIGLYFAKQLASLGCVVFAGVLDPNSAGVKDMLESDGKDKIIIIQVDVTDDMKIKKCFYEIERSVKSRNLELTAVINNAGIMVFGEFEWQTEEQIMNQININIIGYMRIAKTFLPLLHKSKGRLVNVSSHCSLVSLPCLSVYSATKSAIEAWSSSLALELHKFSIPVITILPGSYVQQSGILKNHKKHTEEMWNKMSSYHRISAKDHFDPLMNYMSNVHNPGPIDDPKLFSIIRSALFSYNPKHTYVNSPWRYSVFHKVINMAGPFRNLRRLMILSYMSLPKYR